MSTPSGRPAVDLASSRGNAARDGVLPRAGLLIVLCGMTLLLAGPILPWFHTEMITARPDLSAAPPTSLVQYLIRLLPENASAFVGIALAYVILALGASLSGIRVLAAMAHHRQGPTGVDRADAPVGMLTSISSAGLLGISIFALNGMVMLGWPSSRMMLDGGYFVTLAGFVMAFIGNGLIALART